MRGGDRLLQVLLRLHAMMAFKGSRFILLVAGCALSILASSATGSPYQPGAKRGNDNVSVPKEYSAKKRAKGVKAEDKMHKKDQREEQKEVAEFQDKKRYGKLLGHKNKEAEPDKKKQTGSGR